MVLSLKVELPFHLTLTWKLHQNILTMATLWRHFISSVQATSHKTVNLFSGIVGIFEDYFTVATTEFWLDEEWLVICAMYNWNGILVIAGVSCVGQSGESANMTECLQWAGPLPPQIRECRVACKDDCTLTAWSKFSECAGCGSSRIRKRSLAGKDSLFTDCETHEISRQLFNLCW